jgi:DNA-binding HxlR family transcriptional regulator
MGHAGVQLDSQLDNAGAPLPREALAGQALPGRPCPVAASMALIGEKWSMLALREVFLGNHRFNDIARNTGAPRDRLAARLRALEAAGILERREYSTAPARYGYHLTPAGKALSPVMRALVAWGNTWAIESPRMAHQHHDHDLDLIEVCRTCGEQVHSRDTSVRVLASGWDKTGPIEVALTE